MSTTGHETEAINVQGLKASLKKGGNKGIFNEAICSTAGATAAKVTNTTPPSFSLVSGAKIIVKFTYAITVANATLQVGTTAAKPIYFRGAPLEANIVKSQTHLLLSYDGTAYNIIGGLGGGSEVEIGETAPTEDVKLFVDEDADPTGAINIYNKTEVDAKLANYLPLSGGTMTGALSLITNCYEDGYNNGALHCNNSNIDGVNGIYFADESDNSEGINFYRDATHTDTIFAAGGNLYFTPNRQFELGGVNYTVFHSGNDGSGSGLDADLLDGQHGSYYAVNSQVVKLSSSSYQQITTTSSDAPLSLKGNTTDTYLRFVDKNDNVLGYYVVKSNHQPYFYYNGNAYRIVTESGGTLTGSLNITTNDNGYRVSPPEGEYYSFGASTSGGYVWGGTNGVYLRFLDKKVGVLTSAPSYPLHVIGAVGATAFTQTSDVRKKDIIENLDLDINDIANAPIFKFSWLDPEMPEGVNIGTSAQYWQTVLPEIVTVANDDEKTLSMQYGTTALVSSVALAKKVVEQEETIKAQEARIKALEDAIANIQNMLNK